MLSETRCGYSPISSDQPTLLPHGTLASKNIHISLTSYFLVRNSYYLNLFNPIFCPKPLPTKHRWKSKLSHGAYGMLSEPAAFSRHRILRFSLPHLWPLKGLASTCHQSLNWSATSRAMVHFATIEEHWESCLCLRRPETFKLPFNKSLR